MGSSEVNFEKLQLLTSGLADEGEFNRTVKSLRKRLKIPPQGLRSLEDSQSWYKAAVLEQDEIMSDPGWIERIKTLDENDPDFDKKNRELHDQGRINLLTHSVEEIIINNPDLPENLKSSVENYILFKSLHSPKNYRIFEHYNGIKNVVGMECFGYLTDEEFEAAFKLLKYINRKNFHRIKPLADLKKDIKISKLSKKKGRTLKSNNPDVEGDDKYSDGSIVSAVLPEPLDTKSRYQKNKMFVRKRRERLKQRIKEHFPNTSRKRG